MAKETEVKIKTYEELCYSDDFMFGKTMEDPELCREVIERLLQKPVGELKSTQGQKEFRFTVDGKPIKLDIFSQDDRGTVYDAEMQNLNHRSLDSLHLARRTRFYQSSIDVDYLNRSEAFWKLPESHIMFICTFDPFGKGLGQYTFREKCDEDLTIALEDGTEKHFYNCTYEGGDLPEELKVFYEYVRTGKAGDALTGKLASAVDKAKRNNEWRSAYMKERALIMEYKEEGRTEGLVEGRIEGEDKLASLINALISAGRSQEIEKVVNDKEYRDQLYDEFEINL